MSSGSWSIKMLLEIAINTFGATFAINMLGGQNLFIKAIGAGAGSYVSDMLATALFFSSDANYKLRPQHTSGYPMMTIIAVLINEELGLTSDATAIFIAQLLYALTLPMGSGQVCVKVPWK